MAISLGGTHDTPVNVEQGNDVYEQKCRYRDELEKALSVVALGGTEVVILGRRLRRPDPTMLRRELDITKRELREIILVQGGKSPRWDMRITF